MYEVVIGSSGHGRDIAATLRSPLVYDHHTNYHGAGPYYIGINDPQLRAKVAAELGGPGLRWIHPTAYLGIESVVGPDSHVNYGVMCTRTVIGHTTTIAPGAHISGDVTIGDRVLIGAGAVIAVPRAGCHITIGDDAVVGAGTVVLHDVPAGVTVVGNPARIIKGRT